MLYLRLINVQNAIEHCIAAAGLPPLVAEHKGGNELKKLQAKDIKHRNYRANLPCMQKAAGPTPLGPRKRRKVNYADSPANRRKLEMGTSGKVKEETDDNVSLTSAATEGSSQYDDEELEVWPLIECRHCLILTPQTQAPSRHRIESRRITPL